MILNTAEKFLTLIQHPQKSKFIVSEQIKNSGLIGAILLDLANDKNIEIENGKLIVKSKDTDLSQTHKTILELIEKSSRIRKIKTWISRFSKRIKKYQKNILIGLEINGIIKINHKQFLGIKYYRTQLIKNTDREQIINEIREIVFDNKEINKNNSLILGLIQACKLHKIVCKDKKEIKICKSKMKEIIKSDLISQGVDKVIKEMQAAIVGTIAGATAGAVAASS